MFTYASVLRCSESGLWGVSHSALVTFPCSSTETGCKADVGGPHVWLQGCRVAHNWSGSQDA